MNKVTITIDLDEYVVMPRSGEVKIPRIIREYITKEYTKNQTGWVLWHKLVEQCDVSTDLCLKEIMIRTGVAVPEER